MSSETVGEGVTLQQTPLAVTAAPPLDVMAPPQVAVVEVIALRVSVTSSGTDGEGVVVESSLQLAKSVIQTTISTRLIEINDLVMENILISTSPF